MLLAEDLGRQSTNSNIDHARLESTILEANIRETNISESGFRPISPNSNHREAYETERFDITPGKHNSFSGFVESGENQKGERLFRKCLSQKGVSQQLICDVIKSWRTLWRSHAHGLIKFARYLKQQQVGIIDQNESHSAVMEARTAINMLFDVIGMPLSQLLIQQVMKVHVRETVKVKDKEEIWHLDVLLNYIRLLAVDINLSSTIKRAACMASLIAFINLRLSELYDANILSISDQEVKLETMIWKGLQGRVQLILHQLKNDLSCPVFWILKWRMFCTYMTDFTQKPWDQYQKICVVNTFTNL
ncbi:MAG: hypothetical protein EZS28_009127 [Streblomastix strix]|uniref:Uncharacterized protein n=1 Tax=Streblomastix strix TaxID=222440 RepID=A0A5J4WJX4_9EUKA|nr:MAG: hypothetical protein EZS28_009127 [Streblomastix strix]